jgi:hypothetical protein
MPLLPNHNLKSDCEDYSENKQGFPICLAFL